VADFPAPVDSVARLDMHQAYVVDDDQTLRCLPHLDQVRLPRDCGLEMDFVAVVVDVVVDMAARVVWFLPLWGRSRCQ